MVMLEHPYRYAHRARAVVYDIASGNDLRQMLAD